MNNPIKEIRPRIPAEARDSYDEFVMFEMETLYDLESWLEDYEHSEALGYLRHTYLDNPRVIVL